MKSAAAKRRQTPPSGPGWFLGVAALLAFTVALMYLSRSGPGRLDRTPTTDPANPSAEAVLRDLPRSGARTTPEEVSLARQLSDSTQPFRIRREAALALGKLGTARCIDLLAAALTAKNPPALTAVIAEQLAASGAPEAWEVLRGALTNADEMVAGAAVRALGGLGRPEDSRRIGEMLLDEQTPDGVRAEAALALGGMPGPEALDALSRAATQIRDESLLTEVWQGLGKRPFSETEAVFQSYLNQPDLPSEAKVRALEVLSESEGQVGGFVLNYVTDPDSDVRRAAASTLASVDLTREEVQRLLHVTAGETAPEVRARFYDALAMQDGLDANLLGQFAQSESDPVARLSLYGLLASAVNQEGVDPGLVAQFDRVAVPDLAKRAINPGAYEQRLNAIAVLARSGTGGALETLKNLAGSLPEPQLQAAARKALEKR